VESGGLSADAGEEDDDFDEAAVYAAIERENQHRAMMEQRQAEELARPPPEQVGVSGTFHACMCACVCVCVLCV